MGLFRTSLLVVLSCTVMTVQAANFNQPKAVASTDVEPFFKVLPLKTVLDCLWSFVSCAECLTKSA